MPHAHYILRRVGAALQRGLALVVVAGAAGAVLLSTAGNVRSTQTVDLVLVLALDVSDSVNRREFDLQRTGLVRAFRHPDLVAAIQGGRTGRIAVTIVQWSGFQDQSVTVPWRVIADKAGADAFANRIADMPRSFPNGYTHIAGAIRYATRLIRAAPFMARRSVIDISGDGENNVNVPPHAARDAAVRAGITINGLAIVNETPHLVQYYERNVIGGPGAFVLKADDYETYTDAILRKLLREIKEKLVS